MKIVADVGVNHMGDFNTARKLIEACKDIGIDYVKFQMFFEVFPDLPQLTRNEYIDLIDLCVDLEQPWFATCFDVPSMKLCHGRGMNIWKIPSGLSMNRDYCETIIEYLDGYYKDGFKQKLFVSTGISNEAECVLISDSLYCPSKYDLVMFNCVSNYPAFPSDLNLNVLNAWWAESPMGLSDHTGSYLVPSLAQAMGYEYLEKHITLDRKSEGPDHASSFSPNMFIALKQKLNHAQHIMGSSVKPKLESVDRIGILKRMEEVSLNLDKHEEIR